jgi:hypothetical protein
LFWALDFVRRINEQIVLAHCYRKANVLMLERRRNPAAHPIQIAVALKFISFEGSNAVGYLVFIFHIGERQSRLLQPCQLNWSIFALNLGPPKRTAQYIFIRLQRETPQTFIASRNTFAAITLEIGDLPRSPSTQNQSWTTAASRYLPKGG